MERCEIRPSVIDEFYEECQRQIDDPPYIKGEPDMFYVHFAGQLKEVLPTYPEAEEEFSKVIRRKREKQPFPANSAFEMLLRRYMMDHMDDEAFPYQDSSKIRSDLTTLFDDIGTFRFHCIDMTVWNVCSDVETRAAGKKLVALTLQHDRATNEEEPFTIFNAGNSRGHLLAMIAGNFTFPHVYVDMAGHYGMPFRERSALQEYVNEVLQTPMHLGDSHGMDIGNFGDPNLEQFAKACRFKPLEYKDDGKRRLYEELDEIAKNDPRIHVSCGKLQDIQDESKRADFDLSAKTRNRDLGKESIYDEWLEREGFRQRYDMAFAGSLMYQNFPEVRRRIIDNMRSIVKPLGTVVVQEHCRPVVVPETDHPIDAYEFPGVVGGEFVYTTLVMNQETNWRFEPFAYWNNGRCEVLRPGRLLEKILPQLVMQPAAR